MSKANEMTNPVDAVVMRQIANIAHHGGLIGYKDNWQALCEIRRLTMPYWDAEECNRLQRNKGA